MSCHFKTVSFHLVKLNLCVREVARSSLERRRETRLRELMSVALDLPSQYQHFFTKFSRAAREREKMSQSFNCMMNKPKEITADLHNCSTFESEDKVEEELAQAKSSQTFKIQV